MADRRRGRVAGRDDSIRITDAQTSRAEEIAGRQRRYLWSMAIRTLCVIGAVAVGPGWLRWALVAGAVFLPYVAVVMANATDRRDDDFVMERPDLGRAELPGPDTTRGSA